MILTALLSSCLGARFLTGNQKLLQKQKIKGTENVSKAELEEIITGKPNRRILLLPFATYVGIYETGKRKYNLDFHQNSIITQRLHYDSLLADPANVKKTNSLQRKKERKIAKHEKVIREGNLRMRIGEPISVVDTTGINANVSKMKQYLYSKGHFTANVTSWIRLSGRKAKLRYTVIEGRPYKIDSLVIISPDQRLDSIYKSKSNESLLVAGENYDQSNLRKERTRVDLLMKDMGFYHFSRSYVSFEVDTTRGDRLVDIKTIIKTPPRQPEHTQYELDSVIFTTDAGIALGNLARKSASFRGISYRFKERLYSKRMLDPRVFLRPGDLYSISNTLATQKQLANLDVFKFVNIRFDSTDGNFVANIYTSALEPHQFSSEIGFTVSEVSTYPGPYADISFKKRNALKGLDIFEISTRGAFEGIASVSDQNEYFNIELGLNASLTLPQFLLPISTNARSRLGRFDPKTRIAVGYSFTKRPEYERANTSFSEIYTWRIGNRKQFNFSLIDVNLIRTNEISNSFLTHLQNLQEQGNNLINAFDTSYVSSVTLTMIQNYNPSQINSSSAMRLYLEAGGTILNAFGTTFLENESLEYYKFVKLSFDYRKTRPLTESTSLAWRANVGMALPYSKNNVLPYEKYFFAGGSNSLRAWAPRRLGPGSFNSENDFEQQGEVIIEGSVELRGELTKTVHTAIFVDIGNIWSAKVESTRPGAEFAFNKFYKELAIGTGLGFRFDFSFLLLRLDAGIKVYDPAIVNGVRKGYVLNESWKQPVFNLGIGYPF